MGHKHLTADKREILERLFAQGHSIRSAARILGYSASAICQEKQRAKPPSAKRNYRSAEAQRRAEYRRKNAYRKRRPHCDQLLAFIRHGLRNRWSPEQVSERLAKEFFDDPHMRISFKTIYRWLNKAARSSRADPWRPFVRCLRLKRPGKHFGRERPEPRGPRIALPSIEDRPAEVADRSRLGDWECDLIQGYRRQGLPGQPGLARPCASKRMQAVNRAILSALQAFPREAVRTIILIGEKNSMDTKCLSDGLASKFIFAICIAPANGGKPSRRTVCCDNFSINTRRLPESRRKK